MYAHLTTHALERCAERGIDPELVTQSIKEFNELKGCKVVWKIQARYWAVVYFYNDRGDVVTVFDRKERPTA